MHKILKFSQIRNGALFIYFDIYLVRHVAAMQFEIGFVALGNCSSLCG